MIVYVVNVFLIPSEVNVNMHRLERALIISQLSKESLVN